MCVCVRRCVCVCLCLSSLSLSHFSLLSFVVRELPCTYSRRDERCASQVLNVGALPVPLSVQVYVEARFDCEFTWFFATFAKRKYLNFKMMLRWSQRCQNGAKNGAKMPPRWLLDAPVGVKMALRSATREHLGHILAPRWPTWRTFGSILATFFESWARSCRKLRKPKK